MRKIISISLIILIGFVIGSCKKSDESIDQIEYTITTYASNFSATVTESDVPDFDISVTDIYYNPLNHNVCVTYDIDDDDYVNATYYVVMQEKSTWRSVDSKIFNIISSQFHHQDCFYVPNEKAYRIIIGKYDSDTSFGFMV